MAASARGGGSSMPTPIDVRVHVDVAGRIESILGPAWVHGIAEDAATRVVDSTLAGRDAFDARESERVPG